MLAKKWVGLVVVAVLFALPSRASAQEAVLGGVVTDSTGGVLPGVTVTAVHGASGNTFNSVTDERGEYRIPARTGEYRITAALDGFATVTQTVELLVGQNLRTTFEMVPSALQETITVTGDAALISTTLSTLSANIDRRQMESLPVNGRNWMGLTLLAPGSTATQVNETPIGDWQRDGGMFQILLDGQEITQMIGVSNGYGNTKVSRDAIQEFEFIANRFDAELGHSGGVIVRAVTKSGTNTFNGSLSGFFRDDALNASDFVVGRVLPYSDQQIVGTFGGPIRENVSHFFGYYEQERNPQTWVWAAAGGAWPSFTREYNATNSLKNGGVRFDQQFSPDTRLMIRGHLGRDFFPVSPGFPFLTWHPTNANFEEQQSNSAYGTLTHVLDASTVNEISGGFHHFHYVSDAVWAQNFPQIALRGYFIGKWRTIPRDTTQRTFSIRNNFTAHRSAAGTHDLKIGGEYIQMTVKADEIGNFRDGVIWADRGPIPANIESLFPVFDDLSTWNLAPLSPLVSRYQVSIGENSWQLPRQSGGFWIQDNWSPTGPLTLNLGLRTDFCYGCFADDFEFLPITLLSTRKMQRWSFSPRTGFVYALPNNQTVIRGGAGLYYFAQTEHNGVTSGHNYKQVTLEVPNDGRPNFAADPWNVAGGGKVPTTVEEAIATGRRREYTTWVVGPDARIPYMVQTSIGFQHELAPGLAAQADYVRGDGRALPTRANRNLSCDPVTGANYPFTDVSKRPYPDYGVLPFIYNEGKSESHALQTAVTKRFSKGWQLSGTYTLSKTYNDTTLNGSGTPPDNICDWDAEWSLAIGDQRHRLVLNGIWTLPMGFEVSGLYFYGSGERYQNSYGSDLRNTGNYSANRLRPDGTILERNSFVGEPVHRVDMRLMKRFALGHVTVDGLVEMFNVFNRANYGAYGLVESVAATYGKPVQHTNVAYAPRMLQLGFKVAF